MAELPENIRVQDAVLANMVSIAAILEFLEQQYPGAKDAIEQRAQDIAQNIKREMEGGGASQEEDQE
jgi:hypothetical protein